MTDILGISAFYHDSAACLLRDGEIIAAAQEERFKRYGQKVGNERGRCTFPFGNERDGRKHTREGVHAVETQRNAGRVAREVLEAFAWDGVQQNEERSSGG